MPSFASLFLPLALALPAASASDTAERALPVSTMQPIADTPVIAQVRVQQRVIIRISPRQAGTADFVSMPPRRDRRRPVVEHKMGKCFALSSVAGVAPMEDNRLMLFLKDRRIVAANLEKACSSRDFYSGFYVEPRKDGKVCINRDKLQSRTGAKCELTRLRHMLRDGT